MRHVTWCKFGFVQISSPIQIFVAVSFSITGIFYGDDDTKHNGATRSLAMHEIFLAFVGLGANSVLHLRIVD